ncbi:hypothetical protein niasHS_017996 [Heterodera schachtii]|uniref:Uncharacterized protein n=2 Tax=Heterodera TaxID=34509 RepID=A0ABD2HS96_HETSC
MKNQESQKLIIALGTIPTVSHWHPLDSVLFGNRSPYMKVSEVSCEGCGKNSAKSGWGGQQMPSQFTGDTLDQPILDD